MASFRRDSPPDDYPVIRPPPMRPPPGRPPPPPRTVQWEDRPGHVDSPPRGGFGRGGVSPPRGGFGRGGVSPPRGGFGRGGVSPPSPRRYTDDSPPQRYIEGAPPGYQESPRRFPGRRTNPAPAQYLSPEDSPPYRYSDEITRRYFGEPTHRPFAEDAPLPDDIDGPPPPGFRDEASRRLGTTPAPGFQPSRYHSESESPSPPPGYFRPPPPPPGGVLDDSPRRFGGSPRGQFRRYPDDDESPPTRYADEARRFRGAPRRHPQRSPSPGYAEDQPRRFGGGSPLRFHDGSPRGYNEEPPRRFAGDGSPPSPPQGAHVEELPEDPARRDGLSRPPPQRPISAPRGYDTEDSSPPTRFEAAAAARPPRVAPAGPPPMRAEDAAARFAQPPRQFADVGTTGSRAYREDPSQRIGGEPRQYAAAAAAAGGAAAGAAGAAGLAGYAEDRGRQGPPGGPSGPPPSGYGGDVPPPREFRSTPPRQIPERAPAGPPAPYIGIGTPPGRQDEFPPGGPPPGADPASLPPGANPRFPPDLLGAGALARRRPSPGSEDSSPPGPSLVRYSGADPPALRGPPDGSPLGSSPRFQGLGGRFEHSPDAYGALPPHATPPREGYRPPPPGLGQGGDAPLLGVPSGYATPQRRPGGIGRGGGSPPIPDFLFFRPTRRHPDGYTARTPPRQQERDAIFTAQVLPIELDEKLKDVQPHRGNPGSSTGGGWKDWWAGFLFLVQVGGIAALSIIFGLDGLTHTIDHYDTRNTFHINDWLPQLGAAAVTGAVFAVIWQTSIRMAPVFMILCTIWTGAAILIMVGIVLIATGRTLGLIGVAFIFAGICQALYAFVVRERIPFAAEMFKKVISVCNSCPSTYGVSFSFLFVSAFWLAIWIFGFSGAGVLHEHGLIMAAWVLSLIWTMQVFRNIVRVTVAGTVSLYYFQEHNMPQLTAAIALLRACTSSLGSICFGSFFVPLVEAPCHMLRRINSQAGASEFMFSCVVCFLACFETLIRYFNRLGYIQVAIYGKPFVRAAKDTWDMLRAQGVDCLVHDDLTSTILFLSCGIGGSLSALVGGIYTFIAHKSLTIVITLVSYVIGVLICYIPMAAIESTVATYYVCFAEDPDSLQRYDGPFYERMWVRQMELQAPVNELND